MGLDEVLRILKWGSYGGFVLLSFSKLEKNN
jgi:hypothetical protein